ncbi:MAG: hypothetical protein ACRD5J_05125 [Nitrososphaeraceae archaeon]
MFRIGLESITHPVSSIQLTNPAKKLERKMPSPLIAYGICSQREVRDRRRKIMTLGIKNQSLSVSEVQVTEL